ncbi:MAG: phosphotransferase family protein [Pseudomonadota bacterium]|nr:phosphotransferase family protein [Pseudomonadota bacterium]
MTSVQDQDPELIPQRLDERLETARLEPFLRQNLPQTDGELSVLQFGGGHANLTYMLRFGKSEYVLRRPPLGPIAPKSHDMAREHRVLSRLCQGFPLAPESYLFCDDESLIGAPFQVMERRRGIVIRRHLPPDIAGQPDVNRRIGEMVIDALAALHTVERAAVDLTTLGRAEGFTERQLVGWTDRWKGAGAGPNQDMERLIDWLHKNRPKQEQHALVHNDYKLDNMLVDSGKPWQAVAILDWDMCTSGEPLADLGYLLNQWAEPTDPAAWIEESTMPTAEPGFPSRDEAIERYISRTGFNCDQIHWHYAFAAMRFAVIIQQIYIRYVRGQTKDDRFATFNSRVATYIAKGCTIARL